jgi:hypothetical protein
VNARRVGSGALILAAVLFMAVFSYLAATFGYPDVLDGEAAVVLPKLLALGATGRAVWVLYGIIPLLLIPAALGVRAALGERAPALTRSAVILATISAVAMMLGLLRWPSIHWTLATQFAAANSDAERHAIGAVFLGLNSYLGQFIGEFIGELTLNGFFLVTALAMRRDARFPRWSAAAGMIAAVIGFVAMARNATPMVATIAELENYLLPLWMIVQGTLLLRSQPTSDAERGA